MSSILSAKYEKFIREIVFVCVCVCVCEREREREYVCVREKKKNVF